MKKFTASLALVIFSLFNTTVFAQTLNPTEGGDFEIDDGGINLPGGNIDDLLEIGPIDGPNDFDADFIPQPIGDVAAPTYNYKVVNISQDNADATISGAKEGDVLRYEFDITSDTQDVVDFVLNLDISDVLKSAEMIDAGLGAVAGTNISFPAFTQQAPCQKIYTFFVRVKPCDDDVSIDAAGYGYDLRVPLTCDLVESGPGLNMMWVGLLAVLGLLAFAGMRRSA